MMVGIEGAIVCTVLELTYLDELILVNAALINNNVCKFADYV
jgi:hypothetical protein